MARERAETIGIERNTCELTTVRSASVGPDNPVAFVVAMEQGGKAAQEAATTR